MVYAAMTLAHAEAGPNLKSVAMQGQVIRAENHHLLDQFEIAC
jgi:hypothetical protein